MVEKFRPRTTIEHSEGNDGRDGYDYIEYWCPKCNRRIGGYRYKTACDNCGTFYDWGDDAPRIVDHPLVEW